MKADVEALVPDVRRLAGWMAKRWPGTEADDVVAIALEQLVIADRQWRSDGGTPYKPWVLQKVRWLTFDVLRSMHHTRRVHRPFVTSLDALATDSTPLDHLSLLGTEDVIEVDDAIDLGAMLEEAKARSPRSGKRRRARFQAIVDDLIADPGCPLSPVAERHGVTDARVSQVRTAFRQDVRHLLAEAEAA